jgi:8-oxoguanine deaminase
VPVALLDRHGWLAGDVWCAHAVHIDRSEIGRFAQAGVGVAHCPSSNMRLGSGIAPLRGYLDAGVRVGLGVDGSASNDGAHLLGEARQALLLARVVGGAAALTAREALRLATRGGAEVLGREDLGQISLDRAADVAVYSLDDISLAGAEADPVAALVLSWPPRAHTVIVRGEIVVEDGALITADVQRLIAAQQANGRQLLEAGVRVERGA